MYFLTVSVRLESGRGWAKSSSSGSVTRLRSRCWPGAPRGEDLLLSSLVWSWTGGSSSQPVGLRVLVSHGCPQAAVLNKESKWGKPKAGASRPEVTIFYNLILKVTSPHFCCIFFTRCKSLVPGHTQGRGRGLHQGVSRTSSGSPAPSHKAACLTCQLGTGSCTPVSLILPGSGSLCPWWICKTRRQRLNSLC